MTGYKTETEAGRLTRVQLLELEKICDLFEGELRESEPAEALDLESWVNSASQAIRATLRMELRQIRTEWMQAAMEPTGGLQREMIIRRRGKAESDLGAAAPAERSSLELFQRFDGRFQPLEQLGAGASGVVWKAFDARLNRIVAIKIPHVESAANFASFVREARAESRLDHPGIVRILELGVDAPGCFLLMEYIPGGSLARRMKGSTITVEDTVRLLIEIADTLSYAHVSGIVHRDLKPHNVLIDESGRARLVDFGLAKDWLDDQATPTMSGTMIGTPAYMAPEQANASNGKACPATDIYSAGMILYELLTKELPFRGSMERVLFQVHYVDPVRPSLIQQNIAEALETICLKCLEKNPADRFQPADELRNELIRFRDGNPILSRPASVWKRCRKWASRNRRVAALATLSVLLLAATAVVSTAASLILRQSWQREYDLRITAQDAEVRLRAALQSESSALNQATLARSLAQQQADIAAHEAQASQEALQFLQSIFQNTDPINAFFGNSLTPSGTPQTLKSLLDSAVARIDIDLSGQPMTQARLMDVMVKASQIGVSLASSESVADIPLDQILAIINSNDLASELAQQYTAGLIHRRNHEYDKAILCYEQTIDRLSQVLSEKHAALILIRGDFVGLLYDSGNYKRAFPIASDVQEQAGHICPDHKKLLSFRTTLACELSRASRFAEAAVLYETVVEHGRDKPLHVRDAHQGLIWCCLILGKDEEALAHAEILWNDRFELTAWETAWYAYAYARALAANGRSEEAAAMDGIAYHEASGGSQRPNSAVWLERLAVIHNSNGHFAVAEELLRDAVAIERTSRVPLHPRLADRLGSLAHTLMKQDKRDEARELLQESLAIREKQLPEDDRRIIENRRQLERIAQGDP